MSVLIIKEYQLLTMHELLLNILSRTMTYVDEITINIMYGFQCNRATTDQLFYICQILQKKWSVHQLFIHFSRAYDSAMKVVLYNILTEFGITTILVWLTKKCLNKTYSKVHTR
jgi:hypothetical protein